MSTKEEDEVNGQQHPLDKRKPILNITLQLDVVFAALTVASFVTRLWRLEEPRSVV